MLQALVFSTPTIEIYKISTKRIGDEQREKLNGVVYSIHTIDNNSVANVLNELLH